MQINANVFVVTGGGSGIGRQVVLGLVKRGARAWLPPTSTRQGSPRRPASRAQAIG